MFRLSAFMLLIWKVVSQKSAAGVSLKTLECYTLVFFFRLTSILIYDGYLPYDRSGDWFYQLVEILALVLTCIAAYFVFFVHAVTYERSVDQFGAKFIPSDFGIAYIAGPALLLAIVSGITHSVASWGSASCTASIVLTHFARLLSLCTYVWHFRSSTLD